MWIVTLLLMVGIAIYLPWRLNNIFQIKKRVYLFIITAVSILSAPITMSLSTRIANPLFSIYYNISWISLGFILYLTMLMIIFEVVHLFYKFPVKKTMLSVLGITAGIVLYALINASVFRIEQVTIPIQNLQNEIKIAQISDVHLGVTRSGNYLAKIVKKTNELKPDFVVITGDIADSKIALSKNMFAPLKDLQSPAYFVYGNHDVYVGLDEIIKNMEENNVKVLQNEVVHIGNIKLVGINYMRADDSIHDPHQVNDETIKDILPSLDLNRDVPIVVLHHGPWGIEYMNEYNVDLVIAGHTHAGQLFPATLIANSSFPYNKGLAEYKGTYMYVSQGVGTYMPRMRLGTNNEINFITLSR
jgi:predicted MPP superfamily phosphohydrolase